MALPRVSWPALLVILVIGLSSLLSCKGDLDCGYVPPAWCTPQRDPENLRVIKAKLSQREDAQPAASPDGEHLALVSNLNKTPSIYEMNLHDSTRLRLTQNYGGDWAPRWSPDGSEIVFFSYRTRNYEIYVMNRDGSNQRNISNNYASDSNPHRGSEA